MLNILKEVGKFEYTDIDWGKNYGSKETTLFVTDSTIHSNYSTVKDFYLPTRPVVNVVDEKIVTYPYTELIYQILQAK